MLGETLPGSEAPATAIPVPTGSTSASGDMRAIRGGDVRPSADGDAPPTEGRSAAVADGSTFAPALELLPAEVRANVESLYLLLRTLDDLVDEDDPGALARVQAVERWAQGRRRSRETPETRALERLAERHPLLPRERLLEFCEGMRHDLDGERIETNEDFMRYCQRAGGSVGVVLTCLLGTIEGGDARQAEAGMAALGRAMQVTNILRDIDEDLSHGRVYIPRDRIERLGFPSPGAREQLLREGIAEADALYEQGSVAIPLLRSGRAAMALAADLYREILRQIERDGFGIQHGRAVVPGSRAKDLIAKHSPKRGRALGQSSG